MTTIVDVPMPQADGDPGDEHSPSARSTHAITVPIPPSDTNQEVAVLEDVQVAHSRVCGVHRGYPCNCGIEWNIRHKAKLAEEAAAALQQTVKPFAHEPIGDQLIIERIPEAEGLIVEADIAKDKPVTCEVIAVSKHPSFSYAAAALAALKPGDRILIRRFAGTDVKVDGMEYVIVNVFDVLLKLSEGKSSAAHS